MKNASNSSSVWLAWTYCNSIVYNIMYALVMHAVVATTVCMVIKLQPSLHDANDRRDYV